MSGPYRVVREVFGLPAGGIVKENRRGVPWLCVELPHLSPEIVASLVEQGILIPSSPVPPPRHPRPEIRLLQ